MLVSKAGVFLSLSAEKMKPLSRSWIDKVKFCNGRKKRNGWENLYKWCNEDKPLHSSFDDNTTLQVIPYLLSEQLGQRYQTRTEEFTQNFSEEACA